MSSWNQPTHAAREKSKEAKLIFNTSNEDLAIDINCDL
jgi:hypothetical protein